MSISALLWSFRGRISRQPYWLGSLAIIVLLGVAISLLAGGEIAEGDAAARAGIGLLIPALGIPLIWIGLALGAKRLHDRGKSAWWLVVFYLLPSGLQSVGERLGDVGLVLVLVGLLVSAWGLIELGFLRGTAGPNRFGSDPLASRGTRERPAPS
jgi:uncharacterized membrane protein YhaH (DUF805 family)